MLFTDPITLGPLLFEFTQYSPPQQILFYPDSDVEWLLKQGLFGDIVSIHKISNSKEFRALANNTGLSGLLLKITEDGVSYKWVRLFGFSRADYTLKYISPNNGKEIRCSDTVWCPNRLDLREYSDLNCICLGL